MGGSIAWRSARGAAAAAALLCAGCADLSAVRTWASAGADAAGFNKVVAAYADTPARIAAMGPALPGEDPALGALAKLRAEQAAFLGAAMRVVEDYMAGLAALSAERAPSVRGDVERVGRDLGALGLGAPEERDAIVGLVAALGDAALDGYRRGAVSDLVARADPHLQRLLSPDGGLLAILDVEFRADLLNEARARRIAFAVMAADRRNTPAVSALLARWRVEAEAEHARRMAALDASVASLGGLREGHRLLAARTGALDDPDLARRLLALAKELRGHARTLMAA